MEFRILGPVEVWSGGRPLSLGGPKQRTLLAMLAVHAGRVVSVERLIDALWDDDPPVTATTQVHGYLSALRRILNEGGTAGVGRTLLVTRPPGYLMAVGPDHLDLQTFDHQVGQARAARASGRLPEAADGLRSALAIWRDRALGGTSGSAATSEATRLEERRLAVLEERIETDLALGDHGALIAELAALVSEHPLRERLRGHLMVALYRVGRQAEALATYHEGRRMLAEDFGLDPGPGLRALEQRILLGDADLDLVPVPRPASRNAHLECGRQIGRTLPPLIWTKLQPPMGRELVPRRALVERLCAAVPRKLTLIRAPAGWGKSSLLADWHSAEGEHRPFAWFSIDRSDNDPPRFWTYLIEALRTVDPGVGRHSLPLLEAPGVNLVTDVLPALINELLTSGRPCALVLDDYHLVDNPSIEESVAALLEHLPPTLELVLATRTEPALPLARLRVRRELVEIDAEALRFSPGEATALLNDLHGLTLGRSEIVQLCTHTEGWAAGLYLATLTLRGRDDPGEFIDAIAGDHRHIVDYLGSEVLADQPGAVREFLLRTSILDLLSAPLCDAIIGTSGSARMLTDLERSNSFLIALDPQRHWYRYHHLFGELLRRELDLTEPDRVPQLHRRAAAWHLTEGLVAEAIEHTIAAGDKPAAAELIAVHWSGIVHHGKAHAADSWLRSLGDPAVRNDARTCLVRAWTSFVLGRLDEVLPWTGIAEAAPLPAPFRDGTTSVAAGVSTLRASYWMLAGDMGEARHHAGPACALQRTDEWRASAANSAGIAAYWLGETAEAIAQLELTVRLSEHAPLLEIFALGHLAMFHVEQAEWDRAEERARTALSLAEENGTGESWSTAMAHITQAKVHQHRGQLPEAEKAAERGIELAHRGQIPMDLAYGQLALAQVHHAQGNSTAVQQLLRRTRDTIARCPDPGLLADMIDVLGGRLGDGPSGDDTAPRPPLGPAGNPPVPRTVAASMASAEHDTGRVRTGPAA
ncbi:MAG: BTAD domain-containing putative transcriptional regulator [Pseudonocardia sp.]